MKCLIECGGWEYTRGVCLYHYNIITRYSRSWEELEKFGMANKPKPELWLSRRNDPEWIEMKRKKHNAYRAAKYYQIKADPIKHEQLRAYYRDRYAIRKLNAKRN